jgi:aminomethyltransferase
VRKTILNECHRRLGGHMVPFAGWELPLHYGSQLEEHHRVRADAGMFDVSHMTVTDLAGKEARALLKVLLTNDVDRLAMPGQALYTCMLNPSGGVMDDLIVYRLESGRFRLVTNAGTRDKDRAWISRQSEAFCVDVRPRDDLAIIAVQGPQARRKAGACLPHELREPALALASFTAVWRGEFFVSRTGYTGEDGYEIILPAAEAPALWQCLYEAGVQPCGLGARDTLRLEAGMRLYGADMDESISPLEAGLDFAIAWQPEQRNFIGRAALEAQRAHGSARRFVGLVLKDRGILRGHQKLIVPGIGEGETTSGGFSPTLNRSIALARVPVGAGASCFADIRGQLREAAIVPPRFVRNGLPTVAIESEIGQDSNVMSSKRGVTSR